MPLTDIDGARLDDSALYAGKNLIINGAMQVAQRGTSSTTAGYGTVDRFRSQYTSGTVTQSQESLTSGDPYDEGFRDFLRATNTTAGSNDATEEREIRYYIEAQDLAKSGWDYTSSTSYLTLSFWVRSSLAGTYYNVARSLDGTGQNYTFSYTLTAGTWKKVTHTIPGNSNITINNDNGVGLQVNTMIDLGTDHTDSGHTLNTWAAFSGSSRTPDFGQDWAGTTDATFDITGVQLEVGASASAFEHRSYADDLRRCQRYCHVREADGSLNSYMPMGAGRWSDANRSQIFIDHPVPLRAVPTLTSTAADTFWVNSDGSLAGVNPSSISLNEPGIDCSTVFAHYTTGGRTVGQGTTLYCQDTDLARLTFDSEL